MITFDEKLEAAWGLHKIEKAVLEKEIAELRAENEKLKASLTDEYERGFKDCLKRVEELEREQAKRLEERMKPIKDALYPGPYKPHR